jgi:hypothetical protein
VAGRGLVNSSHEDGLAKTIDVTRKIVSLSQAQVADQPQSPDKGDAIDWKLAKTYLKLGHLPPP